MCESVERFLAKIREQAEEIERLKADRDRFQAYVHAVSPVLDPAFLGRSAEDFGLEARRLQKAEAELAAERAKSQAEFERANQNYLRATRAENLLASSKSEL